MKTSGANSRGVFFLLVLGSLGARADEPRIPEAAPPPELVGRWIEKTSERKGDYAGYNIYCFSRQSEFLVISRVRDERQQKWVEAKKLYRKPRDTLVGYCESIGADTLRFQVVVLAMAVLPIEVEYRARGDVLTLSRDLFDPTAEREVHCERIGRLPEETAEQFAAFQQRLEGGLNGPDFRRVFEFAARQMKDHPRDEEMLLNFIEHRHEFETLREMMQADRELKRVDFDRTKPEDTSSIGLSPERIELYRELCRRVGLERGVEASEDSAKRIAFLASTRGSSTSGSSKSYVWLNTPPAAENGRVLVPDLDFYAEKKRFEWRENMLKHKRTTPRTFDALRHLEGNWYLQYQSEG